MGSSFTKAIAPSAPAFTSPLVFSLITTIRQVVANAREAQGPRRALLVSTKEVQPIMQVLDQIELHHLGMASPVHPHVRPPARSASEIHYLCVIEEEDFHVGVFVLPPRARIPLHDHPGMCVLSRLLCGSLNVKDFDWCDPPSTPQHPNTGKPPSAIRGRAEAAGYDTSSSSSSSSSPSSASSSPRFRRLRGLAVLRSATWVTRPATLSLFKECNNIHEFEAGEDGCAILDVLIPPYDPMQGRPCNYYRATPYVAPTSLGEDGSGGSISQSPLAPPQPPRRRGRPPPQRGGAGEEKGAREQDEEEEGDGGGRPRLEVGRMYRLSPTEAPEEFDVISGIYQGPPPASVEKGWDRGGGGGGGSGSVVGR